MPWINLNTNEIATIFAAIAHSMQHVNERLDMHDFETRHCGEKCPEHCPAGETDAGLAQLHVHQGRLTDLSERLTITSGSEQDSPTDLLHDVFKLLVELDSNYPQITDRDDYWEVAHRVGEYLKASGVVPYNLFPIRDNAGENSS